MDSDWLNSVTRAVICSANALRSYLLTAYSLRYVCMYVVYLNGMECLHKMCAAAKKFEKFAKSPLKKYALNKIKRLKIKIIIKLKQKISGS